MTRAAAKGEARRLVVAEGYTYAAAAEAVGVPLSTVQKWASAEEWQTQKGTAASYDSQMRSIKRSVQDRVAAAIENNAGIGQLSQLIMALEKLEKAYPEHRYTPPAKDPRARLDAGIDALNHFVAWLKANDHRTALALMEPLVEPWAEAWEGSCQQAA